MSGAFAEFSSEAGAQSGVPLWTNRFGPGNESGWSGAIATDREGSVFLTETSTASNLTDHVTIKYSGAGVPLWTNHFDATVVGNSAIAVDTGGNIFVTGTSGSLDYATVAYSGAGVSLWTNRYNGPGDGEDDAIAIAVADTGEVIVTGRSGDTAGYVNYATIAYSNSGLALWTNRYVVNNGNAIPTALGVDRSGNVFVTGSPVTTAYSPAGLPLWTEDLGGAALALDGSGNLFVAGQVWNGSGWDYSTLAFNGTGGLLWSNASAGLMGAIAVTTVGNVWVAGSAATVAYSASGAALWTNHIGGSAIGVDGDGNGFVTATASSEIVTLGYSATGVPLWTNRYNAPGRHSGATGITVDLAGNVLVTGSTLDIAGGNREYVVIKYSSSLPQAHLDFQTLNHELVLSWTNSGFALQASPVTSGAYTNVPGATSPYTISFSDFQRFFRLATP